MAHPGGEQLATLATTFYEELGRVRNMRADAAARIVAARRDFAAVVGAQDYPTNEAHEAAVEAARRVCMTARATIYADYAADLRAMSIKRFKAFHPLHDTAAAAKVFALLASGKPVLLHEDEWALVAAELTKHGIFRTTTIDVVACLPIRVAVVAHPSGALHRTRVAEHTVLDDLFALNDAATSAFPVLRTFPEVCAGSSAARAAAFVHYSLSLLLHDASSPSVPTMCCIVRIGAPPPTRHSQPPST